MHMIMHGKKRQMRISHSAISKYLQCPKMYEYHYVRKIRPNWTSSALLFGDALDKALNELVTKSEKDPYETFVNSWTNGFINKEPIYIPTCTKLLYANKDYDANILTPEDYDEIDERLEKGEATRFDFNELVAKKKQTSWNSFSDSEKAYFNLINWICMKRKAKYILDGYVEKVLPKIIRVLSIQEPIKVDNGAGDELNGFIDLVAELEGHGVVILDHKTSARAYDWDAPSKSVQLALYKHLKGPDFNTEKVGFIVMHKNLDHKRVKICSKCNHDGTASRAKTCDKEIDNKRCHGDWNETSKPEAVFQILIQNMSSEFEKTTIDNVDTVTQAVNTGIFPRNMDKCYDNYGSECPYLKFCHGGEKNMKGLCQND